MAAYNFDIVVIAAGLPICGGNRAGQLKKRVLCIERKRWEESV